ncbi:uncharacterized protein PG986_001112 [Apiospora aurea]|uniref:Uncharacterized protein n=1 Tax=Apiospora aurea TaxID=335848 RepID=A0ABR1QVX3_9PEZI
MRSQVGNTVKESLAGLHYLPEHSDFQSSNATYNHLPDDADQPDVSEDNLQRLAEIFVRHHAHEMYGLHLVHSHSSIPEGAVMIGSCTEVEGRPVCWTKPVPVSAVKGPIHGHIYRLVSGGFVPYEFRYGKLDDRFMKVDEKFFEEVANFLSSNHLDTLLGLEVLGRPEDVASMEFVLGEQGTVMTSKSDVDKGSEFRKTQYTFRVNPMGRPDPVQPGTKHAKTVVKTHKVFIDRQLDTLQDVLSVLHKEQVVDWQIHGELRMFPPSGLLSQLIPTVPNCCGPKAIGGGKVNKVVTR